jgi:predicted dehydrogenase
MLLYDDVNPVEKIRVFNKSVSMNGISGDKKHEQLVEYRIGDMFAPMIPTTEALKIEIDHIAACLLDGEEPISGLESGRKIVQILEAAQRSLRRHGTPQELLAPANAP